MDDDLKRMADDWGYFCEVVWGRTLSDWQKDALQRLASNGSVMTRMTLKEGVSGASFDCIIVDDVYEKPVENGYAECVITKRLRDSCYLAFDDGENDYTTAPQAASRIEQLEAEVKRLEQQLKMARRLAHRSKPEYPPEIGVPHLRED
jgi:hypothetical protein